MTLPSSPNPISFSQIQTEFGGTNPISISEYYRNGSYTTSNNANIPTSEAIRCSNFHGAVREILVVISATITNLNISTLFGSYWTQTVPKRVVINSGVIIGATDTSNYALNIPTGFGGTVKIDNNGSIQGAGGASNGGNGGPAILAGASGISIDNQGTIYGGGGGGGQGGTGGAGSYTYTFPEYQYCEMAVNNNCPYGGTKSYTYRVQCCQGSDNACEKSVWRNVCVETRYSAGGSGGSGGIGQGYNQSQSNAPIFGQTNGPTDGGTNAGRGGVGGNGSTWGTGAANGAVGSNGNYTNSPTLGTAGGPTYGGLGGYYIVNNGNVTWVTNGTRLGRVG